MSRLGLDADMGEVRNALGHREYQYKQNREAARSIKSSRFL